MKRVPLLIFAFSILTSLIFTNLNSWAVPAKPGFVNALQPDGSTVKIRLEGNGSFLKAFTEEGVELTTDEEGFYIPVSKTNHQPQEIEANKRIKQRGPGLMQTTFPSKGEQKALVILVEFTNLTFSMENPHEYYTRMLNEPGYSQDGGTGSARDYFRINSHGQFNPVFDVVGPVTVSDTYQYYGKNNGWGDDDKAPDMIVEACRLVDDEIDFAEYDRDNDGIIDNVFVFYAGYGEADGGGANTIWPHSANMIDVRENLHYYFDDKRLNHYACSNEIQHTTRMIDGIGTFCHEFGHVLGLPDLYSTIFYAFTPGYWDIMSTGSYNNDGRTPPYYSCYERYALDWLTPHELPEGYTTLGDLEKTNKAIIIHTEKDNEYFLLENRQNNGFDKYLPGHGMLVWHIDYNSNVWNNNIVNAFDMHQYVDLLEADNIQDFNTIDGDSFPGAASITEISGKTRPGLVSWSGEASAVRIFDISENDGIISFYVEGGEGEDFDDEVTFDEFLNEESSGVTTTIEETQFIKINGNRIEALSPDTFIYDISGKLVTKLSCGSTELQPGIYIALSNGQAFKFFVRRL